MELDQFSLKEAERTLCQDSFLLLEEAYRAKYRPVLNDPPARVIDISSLDIVSIEGINCSGKTTQVDSIVRRLENKPYVPPRFFPYIPESIINAKTKGNFYDMYNPVADSLIIASAMFEKYQRILATGKSSILTDRSADSLFVYQGRKLSGMGIALEECIGWLMGIVGPIDNDRLRFYLDIDEVSALARSRNRRRENGRQELNGSDILEIRENLRVYRLLQTFRERRYIILDATTQKESLTDAILSRMEQDAI